MGKTADLQEKKKKTGKENGYPANGAPNGGIANGGANGVKNGIEKKELTGKEMYDAVSVGQKVWLAQNIHTNGKNGIDISAFWGDEGVITAKDPSSEMVSVIWSQDKTTATKVYPTMLLLEPVPFKSGEWVRVSHCDGLGGWFSGRALKQSHPVLILDMRRDGKGGYECLVRALPYCARPAWELTIPAENLVRKQLPEMRLAHPYEMCGGYKAGDIVYAVVDVPATGLIPVADGSESNPTTSIANDKPGVQIGRGDVGVVFSWGHDDDHLTVCFEARQDTGNSAWVSMDPKQISRTPPLVKGRRVQLEVPMRFPNGVMAEKGDLGTLLECRMDGDTEDKVLLDSQPGVDKFTFDAPQGCITAIVESEPLAPRKEERLRLIESVAAENERNGRAQYNISMLCQNLLPVLGFGVGIGLGYCSGDRGDTQSTLWTYIPLITETLKCKHIKEKKGEGLDGTLSKEASHSFSHNALISDKSRVDPYVAAIKRASANKHVLDIGTGMMCLLARLCLRAGADTVDAIEVSKRSIVAATAGFDNEAAKHCPAMDDAGNAIPDWASLDVATVTHEQAEGVNPRLTVNLEGESKKPRRLSLFEGYSTDTSLGLSGGYTLLVHEILGDMAGTECAARVVHDIRQRGLCAPDCAFVPQSASTMIAPSAKLSLSLSEKAIFRLGHAGTGELKPLVRYVARHYPISALLADPQHLEYLDFGGELQLKQSRALEFRTIRDDEFDGVHLHLYAQVDETATIDTLTLHNGIAADGSKENDVTSSWNTTYIRLYDTPVPLKKGSRIKLQCVADLEGEVASYSIKASVGEPGEEKHEVEYSFKGC